MTEAKPEQFYTPPVTKYGAAISPGMRTIVALLAPAIVAIFVSQLTSGFFIANPSNDRATTAVILGTMGLTSWVIGVLWYGIPGLGVRTKRPLFASVGFAVMGWVAYLIFHFFWLNLHHYICLFFVYL